MQLLLILQLIIIFTLIFNHFYFILVSITVYSFSSLINLYIFVDFKLIYPFTLIYFRGNFDFFPNFL